MFESDQTVHSGQILVELDMKNKTQLVVSVEAFYWYVPGTSYPHIILPIRYQFYIRTKYSLTFR